MIITKSRDWKTFHEKSIKNNSYPKYPQELMLKTVFGRNSGFNLSINKKSKIIDIGCGFGNNLIPFIDLGAKAYGKPTPRKYHDWVYMADDQINKVLKTAIILVYAYGFYVVITELWEKFT